LVLDVDVVVGWFEGGCGPAPVELGRVEDDGGDLLHDIDAAGGEQGEVKGAVSVGPFQPGDGGRLGVAPGHPGEPVVGRDDQVFPFEVAAFDGEANPEGVVVDAHLAEVFELIDR